jgi:hypothetical protein
MKLSRLCLGDLVCIPLGKDSGSAVPRSDLRESSFSAADGWDLEMVTPGVFVVLRDGMPEPVTIGSSDYTYVEMPPKKKAKAA